jgi:hypothetical protein
MPTQTNVAHPNDKNQNIFITVNSGNANIMSATISRDLQLMPVDADGNPFRESIPFNLGLAGNLKGTEIQIFADLATNPAVSSNTLILNYGMTNVTFLTSKPHTLTSTSFSNGHDTFNVLIDLI